MRSTSWGIATLAAALLLARPVGGIDNNGNGLSDIYEAEYSVSAGADPESDWDNDGLTLQQESLLGTDPRNFASGMRLELFPDRENHELSVLMQMEKGKFFQLEHTSDLQAWVAEPLLYSSSTGYAEQVYESWDPLPGDRKFFRYRFVQEADADQDGLTAWEEDWLGISDTDTDSDNDGMMDAQEWAAGFNPSVRDEDNNGIDDGLDDADGDRMPNGYELANGLNPHADDSLDDLDGDRWPNIFEWAHGVRVDIAGQDPDPSNPVPEPPPILHTDAANTLPDGVTTFRTIWEALDVANSAVRGSDYSVIKVEAGTYNEFPSFGWDSDIEAYRDINVLLLGEIGPSGEPVTIDGDYYEDEYGGWTLLFAGGGTTVLDGFVLERGADGALYAFGSAHVKLVNTTVRDNIANWGAGILVEEASVDCVHCTFQRNSATDGGNAINAYTRGYVTISNSIVWDETGLAPEELLVDDLGSESGAIAVINSIVMGGEYGGMNEDPLFRDADARLTAQSPARDVASANRLLDYDRDGEVRTELVDLGADEFVDSDGDDFPDYLGQSGNGALDTDDDGLTSAAEYNIHQTDWTKADTDGDYMPDGWEVNNGLDPIFEYDASADDDNDGLTNLEEYQRGTDPMNADTDRDGMPDAWEIAHGLLPNSPDDASLDPDFDGLISQLEYVYDSDPNDPDTDDDGTSDLEDGWPRHPVVAPPRLPDVQYAIIDISNTRISNVNDSTDGVAEYFEDPQIGSNQSYAPKFRESVQIADRLISVTNAADDDTLVGSFIQGALDPYGQIVFGGAANLFWPMHGFAWPDAPILPAGESIEFQGTATDSIVIGRNMAGEYLLLDRASAADASGHEWRLLKGQASFLGEVPGTRHTPFNVLGDFTATARTLNAQSSVVFGGKIIFADGTIEDLPSSAGGLTDQDSFGKETAIGSNFIWRDSQFGPLPFANHATVSAKWVNNRHEIIGRVGDYPTGSNTLRYSPVILRNGREDKVRDLADLTGWSSITLNRINDSGMISGSGMHNGILESRFLLLPVEITVKKKGETEPPPDGVVVENGETLEIALTDIPPANFPVPAAQIVWYQQQLKTDGTWTDWQDMGEHARGVTFDHPAQVGGIFQIKAVLLGQEENAVHYLRKKDETMSGPDGTMITYGDGRKGEADAFGVVDDPIQIAVLDQARDALGSRAYAFAATVPAHGKFQEVGPDNHCNIFVAHKADDAGAIVPLFNGFLPPYDPPLANQWAGTQVTTTTGYEGQEFNVAIERWVLLPASAFPQPGFIISHPSAKSTPRGPGHVGLVDYDGLPIAAGGTDVHKRSAHGLLDPKSRMRSYDPNHNPQYIEGWTP